MLTFCDIFPFQGAARGTPVDLQLWKVLEAGGQGEKRKVHGDSPPHPAPYHPEGEGLELAQKKKDGVRITEFLSPAAQMRA